MGGGELKNYIFLLIASCPSSLSLRARTTLFVLANREAVKQSVSEKFGPACRHAIPRKNPQSTLVDPSEKPIRRGDPRKKSSIGGGCGY